MEFKFIKIGNDSSSAGVKAGGNSNFIKTENYAEINSANNAAPSQSSEENLQKAEIFEEDIGEEKQSKQNNKAVTDIPESIPEPPVNGVSKKSIDGAVSYKKEIIEYSDREIGNTPMYRETIEYDDGTVITNIYDGDKLVKSIEDKYSGDPNNPEHKDTRDTVTYYYDEEGNVSYKSKRIGQQEYLGEVGWVDHPGKSEKIFYDEDGNEIREMTYNPETGKVEKSDEWEKLNHDASLYTPGAMRWFDTENNYLGYTLPAESRLNEYDTGRDSKYDLKPWER